MPACPEAQVLRTFCPPAVREHAIVILVRWYTAGRRAARDVVDGLDACKAQQRHDECSQLWHDAAAAVRPVPMLLCAWACANVSLLGVAPLRALVRLAAADAGVARMLEPAADRLLRTPCGLAACLYDGKDLPWIVSKLEAACARFVADMLGCPHTASLPPPNQRSCQLRHQFERAFVH